ncbi:MAG: hypothetical protein HOO91_18130 [Bacteroidales bacterium]|nr:hypothetical protein [Bacteroidales bacterium]
MQSIIKTRTILFFIFILSLLTCCSKNENSSGLVQVKYGTSFGECIGYCKKDLTLKSGSVSYKRYGWTETIEPITFTDILEENSWDLIKGKLDIASFSALPTTIGCPDCADGGAEWIEIELANGEMHKVTFEYYNEPNAVKNYINDLREIMNSFENRSSN